MIDRPTLSASSATYPDETTLLAPFTRFLRNPEVRQTTRSLLDGELVRVVPGWPRQIAAGKEGDWLRASDVLIELAHEPARAAFELGLALHAESATRLVERVLGGGENTATASLSGAPSEAECGVLAYAAARLLVASGEPLQLRAVSREAARAAAAQSLLVWPLSCSTSFGTLQSTLLLSVALAEQLPWRVGVSLFLRDRAEGDPVSELASGDLLLSDGWNLTATSEGLTGDVLLAADGADGVCSARLSRGELTARAFVAPSAAGELELVLTRRSLSLPELARFAAGEPLPLAPAPGETATLRARGANVARGELVVQRGALGLRVDELLAG